MNKAIEAPTFDAAVDDGNVIGRSGYHQPRSRHYDGNCGCRNTTRKGAYRDMTVKMPDGRTVTFYHQSPIVVQHQGRFRVSSCGYRTATTKQRISRTLPDGYSVKQRDFEWFIVTPDDEWREFHDGMVLDLRGEA